MSRGGAEVLLRHGPYEAVVTEIGGGLRLLQHDGRDLIRPYEAGTLRPRYRGSVLAPWPNRVADGRYAFGGEEHQLALTEPERGNALHGLICWERFEVRVHSAGSATVRHRLVPQQGYPFELDLLVRYDLDDSGLHTQVTATNTGDVPAPYGVAPHPYLVAPGALADWRLRLPAGRILEVTPDRLLPTEVVAVSDDRDFREARTIGATELDHAFTEIGSDEDGLARVVLADADGTGVECRWDPEVLPWVQIHTADLPQEPEQSRRGLAVEPMTCAPDAFNSGAGLVVLAPGDQHQASWTIGALAAATA